MTIHEKLKKFIIDKLLEDLLKKEVLPYSNEFWVIDRDRVEWYLYVDSAGNLVYNQIFFKNYFSLFTLGNKEFDKILKKWFENNFNIPIRTTARKNSNLEYVLVKMLNQSFDRWSIKERKGFSYEIVKRFLDIEKNTDRVLVEDFIFL